MNIICRCHLHHVKLSALRFWRRRFKKDFPYMVSLKVMAPERSQFSPKVQSFNKIGVDIHKNATQQI